MPHSSTVALIGALLFAFSLQLFSTSGTKVPPPTNVVASASHHSATLAFTAPPGIVNQYVVAYREASDTTGDWSIIHQPEEPAATTTTLHFLSPSIVIVTFAVTV
jgi:hypothetical protein